MGTPTEDTEPRDGQRPSRYQWRYGPVRLVMPWAAVVVGVLLAVMHRTPMLLWAGIGLIALGVAFFFVYRFMAKRGI